MTVASVRGRRELRRAGLLRAALLAGIALLGAGTAGAQPAGSLLRVRLNADIRSTDPGVNRDGNTDGVVQHLLEGLVAFREDTTVGPLLAERVETSADGLAYTFVLRDGLRFSNGAPLTSADAVAALERYMRPATGWRCRPELDGGVVRVAAVEAPDPRTLVVRLDRPSALFLPTLARPDCGGTGIYHRDSLGPDGAWRAPVGTGPFTLGEWRRGQLVELRRHDGYAGRGGPRDGYTGGKQALVERVRYTVIPDAAAAKAALLSGSIDLIPDVSPTDLAELRGRRDVRVEVASTLGLVGLLLQANDPLLRDVRVRRALALSLDYPELVRALAEDLAPYNASAIPSASPWHKAAHAAGYRRDLPEAKRLLAEAGYRGQPLKILTNRRYSSMYEMAVLVQAMAAEAGLKVEFEVIDWATQLDRYTRGEFAAMAFAYSARLDPSLSYEMFTGPKATQPRKLWDDPAAETALRESMAEGDPARRQALFDALHARMLEAVPAIWLYNDAEVAALRANVEGYKGWAVGQPRLWGVQLR